MPTQQCKNEFCSVTCLSEFKDAYNKGACCQCDNVIRGSPVHYEQPDGPPKEFCSTSCLNKEVTDIKKGASRGDTMVEESMLTDLLQEEERLRQEAIFFQEQARLAEKRLAELAKKRKKIGEETKLSINTSNTAQLAQSSTPDGIKEDHNKKNIKEANRQKEKKKKKSLVEESQKGSKERVKPNKPPSSNFPGYIRKQPPRLVKLRQQQQLAQQHETLDIAEVNKNNQGSPPLYPANGQTGVLPVLKLPQNTFKTVLNDIFEPVQMEPMRQILSSPDPPHPPCILRSSLLNPDDIIWNLPTSGSSAEESYNYGGGGGGGYGANGGGYGAAAAQPPPAAAAAAPGGYGQQASYDQSGGYNQPPPGNWGGQPAAAPGYGGGTAQPAQTEISWRIPNSAEDAEHVRYLLELGAGAAAGASTHPKQPGVRRRRGLIRPLPKPDQWELTSESDEPEKKKKKRKRGGRLKRLRKSCQRMGRLSRKGKKWRAMLQLQLQNNDSDPLAGSSTLSDMSHCTVARVPLIKQEPIEDSVSDEDEEFEVNCEVELGSCELSKVDGKEIRVKKETVEEPLRSDVNGLTPLHVCAQENRVGVAAVLVQNGANVNAVSKAGYTPLHVACYYGNMDMVQFLLENGASVNAGTAGGTAAGWEAALKMPPGGEE